MPEGETEGTKKKKIEQDQIFLVDKMTGQSWEHAKSPVSRRLDGGQRAVVYKITQELKRKYGHKGYAVRVVQQRVPS